jgi:predicted nuclease with TOPRIM domain
MTKLILLHLTFLGPGKAPATVEFSTGLTVIYGASDTGKSFIVEAVDYMLGASTLKTIQEAEGYTRILLGLRLENGQIVTLVRAPGDNNVGVFNRDLRDLTSEPPDKTLSFKHNPKSERNLSRFLLGILGADGRKILRNARHELRSLSFRDLAHLCVISERQMAAPRSPVLSSGQNNKQTEEKSVFKVLLTGEDEAAGREGPSDVEKKVGKGKIDLLEQLIAQNQGNLILQVNETELREQLARLDASLAEASASVGQLVTRRSTLVGQHQTLEAEATDNRRRTGEVHDLLARFGLLRQQYESDLSRLQMVGEAGNMLGYFRSGTCVFCGAEPEHQQPGHHLEETTQLQEAVVAETRKTAELHTDLLSTIEDLETQLGNLNAAHAATQDETTRINGDLADLDERLTPLHASTKELLTTRSQTERELTIYAQIQQLEDVKAGLTSSPAVPIPTRPDGIPAADVIEFERMVQQTLLAWKVPGENRVSYDQGTAEVSVDGRARGSRGKGMQSIIHAAFSTALARHSLGRSLIHPGFVVLDSPVLTYRQPNETVNDTELTPDVVEHFYRGLLNNFPNQVIVVENGDPPADIDKYAYVYAFSTSNSDRAGFFPHQHKD